jgi:hypothetical protein
MLGIVAGHYEFDWNEAERRFRLAAFSCEYAGVSAVSPQLGMNGDTTDSSDARDAFIWLH